MTPAYRMLNVGEVIQEGDEWQRGSEWLPVFPHGLGQRVLAGNENFFRRPAPAEVQAATTTLEEVTPRIDEAVARIGSEDLEDFTKFHKLADFAGELEKELTTLRSVTEQANRERDEANDYSSDELSIGAIVQNKGGCRAVVDAISEQGVTLVHRKTNHHNSGKAHLNSWKNFRQNWKLVTEEKETVQDWKDMEEAASSALSQAITERDDWKACAAEYEKNRDALAARVAAVEHELKVTTEVSDERLALIHRTAARVAELEKDKERLDWLEKTQTTVGYNVELGAWGVDFEAPHGPTLRAAIDAGREQS